jgi:hypothetical protein
MTAEQPQMSPATPTRRRHGGLFWALVAVVFLAAAVAGGGYLAYRYTIDRLTDATPLDLGEPTISPAELGGLDGRVAAFVHAIRNKNPVEPLVLTAQELTSLVARSPEFRRLGAHARFSIGNGEIHGELSVPLERMGYPDRWFNGSAAFAVLLENGVLIVTLQSASVKGEPVPGWILQRLRNRNLAQDLHERPLATGLIARLESIEVGNGRITLVPRLRR